MMRRNDELAVQENLLSHPQGTHLGDFCNSAAMAFLQLRNNYLNNNPSDAQWETLYEECVTGLQALRVEDFFKPGEMDLPEKLELKTKIIAQLESLITYMIGRMNDAPQPSLDRVTLYHPDTQGGFSEEGLDVRLKKVLPLCFKAYLDSEKFSGAYTSLGSQEERRARAEEDKPLRLYSMFCSFQGLRAGTCHTGIRNELLMLLNGTYENIHIIEDVSAFAISYYKEQIYQRFLTTYQHSQDKKLLLSTLYTWITEGNPSELLNMIDPHHTIKTALIETIIAHGINPDMPSINMGGERRPFRDVGEQVGLASYLTLHLNFDANGNQVLNQVNTILTASAPGQALKSSALLRIQEWIQEQFLLNSPRHAKVVESFYLVFNADLALNHNRSLLLGTETLSQEAIDREARVFNDYYQSIAESTGVQLPTLDATQKHDINTLTETISRVRESSSSDKVQNFFQIWSMSIRSRDFKTLRSLYAILSDEGTQQNLLLNNHAIETLISDAKRTEHGEEFIGMTPYLINRFFLHAIIQEPHEWTEEFAHEFKKILDFVKSDFDSNDHLARNLRSGYDTELITQLDYLYAMWQYTQSTASSASSQPPARPQFYLLLPTKIRTAREWINISNLLDDTQRTALYNRLRPVVEPSLVAYSQGQGRAAEDDFHPFFFFPGPSLHHFMQAFRSLPENACRRFLASLPALPVNDLLYFGVMNRGHEFPELILTESQREALFDAFRSLSLEQIREVVGDGARLSQILESFYRETERMDFLHAFDIEAIKTLLNNRGHPSSELASICATIPDVQFNAFIEAFSQEFITNTIKKSNDIYNFLRSLSVSQRGLFIMTYGMQNINDIITSTPEVMHYECFGLILSGIEPQQFKAWVDNFGIKEKLTQKTYGFFKLLKPLSSEQVTMVIQILTPEFIATIFKDGYKLRELLTKGSEERNQSAVINALGVHIKSILRDERELGAFLETLCSETFTLSVHVLGVDLIKSIIKTKRGFDVIEEELRYSDNLQSFKNTLGQAFIDALPLTVSQPRQTFFASTVVDINAYDKGNTLAHQIAHHGDASKIAELISKGADFYMIDHDAHFSPAMIAAFHSHLSFLSKLTELGIDCNRPNDQSITALFIAACKGHMDVVEFLLAHGAQLEPSTIPLETFIDMVESTMNSHAKSRMKKFISEAQATSTNHEAILVSPEDIANIMGHNHVAETLAYRASTMQIK